MFVQRALLALAILGLFFSGATFSVAVIPESGDPDEPSFSTEYTSNSPVFPTENWPVFPTENSPVFPTEPSTTETTASPACPPPVETPTEVPRLSGSCYVSEPKATKLILQMAVWIRTLNSDKDIRDFYKIEQRVEQVAGTDMKTLCSENRLEQLVEELIDVGRQLWKLSIRLEDPSALEIDELDKKKVWLIRFLRELRVFTGQTLSSTSMLLHTFENDLELLEFGFNSALTMFYSSRPVRSPLFSPNTTESVNATSTSTLKPITNVDSDAGIILTVSNMFAGSLGNFNDVIGFIASLASNESKVVGFSALYDQMDLNSHLETSQLVELAARVKPITVSGLRRAEMKDLKQKLGDVMKFVGAKSSCNAMNVAFQRNLVTYDPGWPEYTCLGSSGSSSPHSYEHQAGSGLFRIKHGYPVYATESGTRSGTKRHVYEWDNADVLARAFLDWKLIPVQGGKYFKILNAKYDEVLFAGRFEMHSSYTGVRRVFLSRRDLTGAPADIPTNADLWSFNCTHSPT